MMMYNCAIREVRTKLEVLNDDLAVRRQRNPIESIKSRIKKPESIISKMRRNGWEISVDSITQHLNDVAGVRVICAFVDDIFEVSRMLAIQDDIQVVEIKDYIHNPKPNGYRSYHMIVEVPVFFSDRKQSMRVEIQIRTIAMDFWSSLEHTLKYKKNLPDSAEIIEELRQCAEGISQIDCQMMDIRNRIHGKEEQ
jgi:putative GTP pyrophosphokinase